MPEYSSGMCFTIFWKGPFCCLTSVAQYLSNSLQHHGDSLPGFTVHGILLARILEAIPFSRGSSQPRERIQVSCIVGRFFTIWATREAQSGVPACGSSHHRSHISPPPAQTLPPPAGLPPMCSQQLRGEASALAYLPREHWIISGFFVSFFFFFFLCWAGYLKGYSICSFSFELKRGWGVIGSTFWAIMGPRTLSCFQCLTRACFRPPWSYWVNHILHRLSFLCFIHKDYLIGKDSNHYSQSCVDAFKYTVSYSPHDNEMSTVRNPDSQMRKI